MKGASGEGISHSMEKQLLGRWELDPSDSAALEELGKVSLSFRPGGSLLYVVHLPDRDQVLRLTYRIDGESLITDQPSSPREERTKLQIDELGRLVLRFGEQESRFLRVQTNAKT